MKSGTIILVDGIAHVEILNGPILKIHRNIFVHSDYAGESCTVEKIHPFKDYVEEFSMNGKRWHKKMNRDEGPNQKPKAKRKGEKRPCDIPPSPKKKNLKPEGNRKSARAPYNFIPLNAQVVLSDEEVPHFDQYHHKRHTGYIDLEIESKSPIYIRGEEEHFFAVDGVPTIPGSTLRGMLRNQVEIMSFGQFLPNQSFEDARLYNRSSFNVKSRVREYYTYHTCKVKAGFLMYEKEADSYCIRPANLPEEAKELPRIKKSNLKFEYKRKGRGWEVHSGVAGKKKEQWFIPDPAPDAPRIPLHERDLEAYQDDRTREAKKMMQDLVESARTLDRKTFPYGLPIFYSEYKDGQGNGRIAFGHTRFYRIPYGLSVADHVPAPLRERRKQPDLASAIFGFAGEKPEDPIRAGRVYVEDAPLQNATSARTGYPRILSTPKPTSFQLYLEQPCGFQTPERELDHWGEPGVNLRGYKLYWHILNENAAKDRNWEQAEPSLSFDLFGGKEAALGLLRKYGKCLEQKKGRNEIVLKTPLHACPKPLEQLLREIFFDQKTLKGKKKDKKPSQFSPIAPLPTGSRFKSRIRFENLSKVELGALLMALDLPAGLGHKIGLGKPLGLGSVRLHPHLVLSTRTDRYASLLDTANSEWCLGEKGEADLTPYKDAFAQFIGKEIGEHAVMSSADFWKMKRMVTLACMLSLEGGKAAADWLARTAYMEFASEDYKRRKVLATPEEVEEGNCY